ncbi:cytochrome p450 [Trifolium pratense]|uniref:Cytochrome p450 n=1 Tax=Trifolium pratense TaxID=57577 RepID=A0A2K3M862_TRIPR|nr:cytochrome p450 [Trifolium pratense]
MEGWYLSTVVDPIVTARESIDRTCYSVPAAESAVNSSNTVSETIFMLLQNLEEQNSARLAVIMWSIWKNRNMKLWNKATETKEQILNRVDHLLEDWHAAKNMQKKATQQRLKVLLS